MNRETHLLRIDITHSEDGKFGCTVSNGSGDMLIEIPQHHADRFKAVKAALHYLTENDLQGLAV